MYGPFLARNAFSFTFGSNVNPFHFRHIWYRIKIISMSLLAGPISPSAIRPFSANKNSKLAFGFAFEISAWSGFLNSASHLLPISLIISKFNFFVMSPIISLFKRIKNQSVLGEKNPFALRLHCLLIIFGVSIGRNHANMNHLPKPVFIFSQF